MNTEQEKRQVAEQDLEQRVHRRLARITLFGGFNIDSSSN